RAVVRAARPAGRAQGHGDARDPRPARGGVPGRHGVRDVEPAGAHRAPLRGEPAAAARPRGHLCAGVPGHRPRAAQPDRRKTLMDRRELTLKVVSPTVFVIAMFVLWELACRALKVPLAILP